MKIRVTEKGDCNEIAAIYNVFARSAGWTDCEEEHFANVHRKSLDLEETVSLTLLDGNDVVGCLLGRITNQVRKDSPAGAIDAFVVDPKYRGKASQKVVEVFEKIARIKGATEIWTTIPMDAAPALRFYSRNGFGPAEYLYRKEL